MKKKNKKQTVILQINAIKSFQILFSSSMYSKIDIVLYIYHYRGQLRLCRDNGFFKGQTFC